MGALGKCLLIQPLIYSDMNILNIYVRFEWFHMKIVIIGRNFPLGGHKDDFYHSSSKSENGVVYCLLQIYGRAVWKLFQDPHSPVLPF